MAMNSYGRHKTPEKDNPLQTTLPPVAVFDLDGTLVDTLPDLTEALNVSLESEGLVRVSLNDARNGVGHGARRMIEYAVTAQGVPAEEERVSRMHARFLEFYRDNIAVSSRPFPGAETALTVLSERGILLAVCTNKYESFAIELLETLGMAGRFAAIAGGDTFGVSKPDPLHLTRTVEAAKGGRAVMIGDSNADVGAARAAGIPSIAVAFGYSTVPVRELGADALIDHFDELEAHALQLLEIEAAKPLSA